MADRIGLDAKSLVGRTIDRYEILEHVGSGGFAHVYKVRRGPSAPLKTLKIARVPGVNPAIENEFNLFTSDRVRQHPQFPNAQSAGEYNGHAFFVREHVPKTLADLLLDETKLSAKRSLDITQRLLAAVHRLDLWEIVHYDLKPSNIGLKPNTDPTNDMEDEVLIFDVTGGERFFPDSDSGLIASGALETGGYQQIRDLREFARTEFFSAPDGKVPIDGMIHPISVKSDLYSVGAVLYTMLTGNVPVGTIVDPSEQKRSIRERVFTRACPAWVHPKLILRALEPNPANRFQSVDEMLDTLANGRKGAYDPKNKIKRFLMGTTLAATLATPFFGPLVYWHRGPATTLEEEFQKDVEEEKVSGYIVGVEDRNVVRHYRAADAFKTEINTVDIGTDLDEIVKIKHGHDMVVFALGREEGSDISQTIYRVNLGAHNQKPQFMVNVKDAYNSLMNFYLEKHQNNAEEASKEFKKQFPHLEPDQEITDFYFATDDNSTNPRLHLEIGGHFYRLHLPGQGRLPTLHAGGEFVHRRPQQQSPDGKYLVEANGGGWNVAFHFFMRDGAYFTRNDESWGGFYNRTDIHHPIWIPGEYTQQPVASPAPQSTTAPTNSTSKD